MKVFYPKSISAANRLQKEIDNQKGYARMAPEGLLMGGLRKQALPEQEIGIYESIQSFSDLSQSH